MKKLFFAAMAAMVVVSVSSVFANQSSSLKASYLAPQDTDTVVTDTTAKQNDAFGGYVNLTDTTDTTQAPAQPAEEPQSQPADTASEQ